MIDRADQPVIDPITLASAQAQTRELLNWARVRRARPFRIFAFLGCQALGDFVFQALTAASIKALFPWVRLTIYFRDDRPYKRAILGFCPYFDEILTGDAEAASALPLDWFDVGWFAPMRCPDPNWHKKEMAEQDFLLLPSMMPNGAIVDFERPAQLRIPDSHEALLAEALEKAGVARDRWFACLHVREGNYQFRMGQHAVRSPPLADYLKLAMHIVREQGGQVVRLGHPGMTVWPRMPGLIDLGDADFALQAYAVARARYMIGCDSGPTMLGSAFGTPTGATNMIGFGAVWNAEDYYLTQRQKLPDGRILHQRELLDAGLLQFNDTFAEIAYLPNSARELIGVADSLRDDTENCVDWRQSIVPPRPVQPAQFVWPLPRRPWRVKFWSDVSA